MFESGSSFVLTNIDIEGELPVELIPGYFLRRANDVEIAYFKDCIDKISGSGSFPLPNVWCQYEYTFSKERHENNTTFHRKHLPKEKWKYWVVAYNGVNTNLHKLAYIATLLSVDIDFGIDVFFDQIDQAGTIQGYSFMGNQISGFCSNNEPYANAKTLNVGDLAVIGKYLDRRRLVSHWVHPCRVSITQWTRRFRRSALPRLPCVRDDTCIITPTMALRHSMAIGDYRPSCHSPWPTAFE